MTTRYKQWTPEEFDPATDPLSEQVGERETEDVQRDPEADAQPEIIRVGNTPPQPVPAFVDHGQLDPTVPPVDRVDATAHLQGGQPSTDPHSDDQLDHREGVPWHKGIFRQRDARGRERFSIDYIDAAGNRRTQTVDGRTLADAEEALALALLEPGREAIR